jgi:SAM-dependent methyltransferase
MGAQEWAGYCPICDGISTFHAYGTWYRDELVCLGCGSVPRQRALFLVLATLRPDWRSLRIWEVAPAGAASDKLRRECARYMASHFWPDVTPGQLVDGVRCEDLERPTFDSDSIDVVVSSDVFEHVLDVDAALAQVARVLVPGGIHVWTTPRYRDLAVSRPRAQRGAGAVEYLLPAEYHGDPVNPEGALVTFDWGLDLADRVHAVSGMFTTSFHTEARHNGLLGEFLEVFVSARAVGGPVAELVARRTPASSGA